MKLWGVLNDRHHCKNSTTVVLKSKICRDYSDPWKLLRNCAILNSFVEFLLWSRCSDKKQYGRRIQNCVTDYSRFDFNRYPPNSLNKTTNTVPKFKGTACCTRKMTVFWIVSSNFIKNISCFEFRSIKILLQADRTELIDHDRAYKMLEEDQQEKSTE